MVLTLCFEFWNCKASVIWNHNSGVLQTLVHFASVYCAYCFSGRVSHGVLCKPTALSGDELKLTPPSPHPSLFPDFSVALPVSCTALFPMDLRVGERGMRPGSDTALLTPLHPPLLLTPFSPQPRTSFSQQQLHQHIRVRNGKQGLNTNCPWKDFKMLYITFSYMLISRNMCCYNINVSWWGLV